MSGAMTKRRRLCGMDAIRPRAPGARLPRVEDPDGNADSVATAGAAPGNQSAWAYRDVLVDRTRHALDLRIHHPGPFPSLANRARKPEYEPRVRIQALCKASDSCGRRTARGYWDCSPREPRGRAWETVARNEPPPWLRGLTPRHIVVSPERCMPLAAPHRPRRGRSTLLAQPPRHGPLRFFLLE